MLVIIFIITSIKDNMFYLFISHVLLQAISFNHEMFGPVNYDFWNNAIHRNQDPINQISLCPIKLCHPRNMLFSTCIIILPTFSLNSWSTLNQKNKGMGLGGSQSWWKLELFWFKLNNFYFSLLVIEAFKNHFIIKFWIFGE